MRICARLQGIKKHLCYDAKLQTKQTKKVQTELSLFDLSPEHYLYIYIKNDLVLTVNLIFTTSSLHIDICYT